MITLSNSFSSVFIREMGAELSGILSGGREFVWQGDGRFWGRRAPILFPIVGRVFNNEYRLGNRTFTLSQHGFARDTEFEVKSCSENECLLEMRSSDGTRERYPFDFRLQARYLLEGKTLVCRWEVFNTGSDDMPCQIGGHPGFNYMDYPNGTDRGKLKILKGGKAVGSLTAARIGGNGCVLPKREKIVLEEGIMRLDSSTFDEGVYILEDSQCDEIRMTDRGGREYLTLRSSAPVFGLWSPEHKDAPFVCIEPWLGRTDPDGYAGDFSEKPWINIVEKGKSLTFEYTVEWV